MQVWTVTILNNADPGYQPWTSSFSSERAADSFMDEAIRKLERYGMRENVSVIKDNMPLDDKEYLNWIDAEYGPDNSRLYKRFEIFGTPVLFIDNNFGGYDYYNAIHYLHIFDLRHGDDDSIPLTLEETVTVNRFGTILSPVDFLEITSSGDYCGRRSICDDDWSFCSDLPDCTLKEFMEELWRKEDEDNI